MSGTELKQRLAAILAADVAEYSRLMAAGERATVAALDAARAVFQKQVEANQGRVIDMAGDSVLAVFETATGAVSAALAVQQELNASSIAVPEDRRMRFRIGVHLGDVIEKADGTVYGDGVNIAARLEGLAEPGGIAVSESVRTAVRGKVAATFLDHGERTVKNITEPVRTFLVTASSHITSKPSSAIGEIALSLPDKPSIAVLPFTNMSGDQEQDYFADGVVEEIITGLSRIKSLFVIARNSSFIYKGKAIDVKQVGRELGVRYVLEGSVRRASNRVRITGQLIEAETGAHLWAERYDRSLDDIFALQDEITANVIGAIEPSLRNAEIERIRRTRPNSLDAYDLVLRALPFVFTAMPEHAATAIPLLEKALQVEPGYAAAHAALAWCLHQRFSRGGLHEEDRVRAIHHARSAIAHGGDDATALASAAFVISLDEHDHATALNIFDRALALSSSNVFALHWRQTQRATRSASTRASASLTLCWRRRSFGSVARKRPRLRRGGYLPSNPVLLSAAFQSRLGSHQLSIRPSPMPGEKWGCRSERVGMRACMLTCL